MARNRRGYVGEAVTPADRARRDGWSERKDRNFLPRMIRAAPSRVAAVVGGNDDEIARSRESMDLGHPPIKCLERRSIAGRIAAMAMDRIEIDEIRKQQPTVGERFHSLQGPIKQRCVPVRFEHSPGSGMGKNIGDLSDGNHITAGLTCPIEQRRSGRWNGIIASISGPGEGLGRVADEWPSDDAADPERIEEPARDRTDMIEPLDPKAVLVGCDLKDAVG